MKSLIQQNLVERNRPQQRTMKRTFILRMMVREHEIRPPDTPAASLGDVLHCTKC